VVGASVNAILSAALKMGSLEPAVKSCDGGVWRVVRGNGREEESGKGENAKRCVLNAGAKFGLQQLSKQA
jgi:hypothetical protein